MEPDTLPDQGGETADSTPSAPDPPGTAADTFTTFRQAVLDVVEQGEEVVVTTRVWTVAELVFTRRVTERSVVVRDTVRTVEVDVDPYSAIARNSDPHAG